MKFLVNVAQVRSNCGHGNVHFPANFLAGVSPGEERQDFIFPFRERHATPLCAGSWKDNTTRRAIWQLMVAPPSRASLIAANTSSGSERLRR